VESRLPTVAEVQTGVAKGGLESDTSHRAKRQCETVTRPRPAKKVDGANVATSGMVASNGVIHVIDTVLLPR